MRTPDGPYYVYEVTLRDGSGRERRVLAADVVWLPGALACRMHGTLLPIDETFPARQVAKVVRLEVIDGTYRPADGGPDA